MSPVMNETSDPPPMHAGLAGATLLAFGVLVWAAVSFITGDMALGLLYGLAPGLVLGGLAVLRLRRGGLFRRERTPDTPDREQA